jgi:hypothetical protein
MSKDHLKTLKMPPKSKKKTLIETDSDMGDGGIQHAFLGTNYQFKLLELFVHRSVESKLDFELKTELKKAGKFDDVALKYISDGDSKFIFCQAKHSKNPETLNLKRFIDDKNKDFYLFDYFTSLNEVQKNYGNVENVFLVTNNKIDDIRKVQIENTELYEFASGDKKLCLYLIEDTSIESTLKNHGKHFKLPNEIRSPPGHQTTFETLRCIFMFKELLDFLLGKTSELKLIKVNRRYLFTNIFDKTKLHFRDEILKGNNLTPIAKIFRAAFEKCNKGQNDYWKFWENKDLSELLKQLLKIQGDEDEEQENFDLELNRFMDKFVLVTRLEIEDIERSIQTDMQENYHMQNVSSQYQVLTNSVKDWITGSNKNYPLTKEVYEGFFKTLDFDFWRTYIMDLKESSFKERLHFKSANSDIRKFLDLSTAQDSKQILHIITPKSEELFISMSIYSMLTKKGGAPRDYFIMLKTSDTRKIIEQSIKIFETDTSSHLLILQIDQKCELAKEDANILLKATVDKSKRVVAISNRNWINIFQSPEIIEIDSKTYLTDLTEKSLDDVLKINISFQTFSTNWKDLLDEKIYSKTLLVDLINKKSVAENVQVSKDFNQDLYISRSLLYKNALTPDVLKKLTNGEFADNEEDFNRKCQTNSKCHWLENLKWVKSWGNISDILEFIDENNSERITENNMARSSKRLIILIDVAGMGKTTILNYLAQEIKKNLPTNWVAKIDLNDYTSLIEDVTSNDLKTPDQAVEYLLEKILKLDNEFEKELFRRSCHETGNVILFFDGYDEVASFYKSQVLQIIESLLETRIQKIYIASRPECSTDLKNRFLQLEHSLVPFDKKDQEDYLLRFMRGKFQNIGQNLLEKLVEMIFLSMSESISDKQYKFTGAPLITKLVGDYFEQKINENFSESNGDLNSFIVKSKTKKFDLLTLYDHFVDKNLIVYFKEKCEMNPSNPRVFRMIKKEKVEIIKNYGVFAVQQILKSDVTKYLPSFEVEILEDQLTALVEVGLVYEVNSDRKFVHQTFGEWCFNRFLDDHFDDEDCSKFIVEVVLIEDSYRIIRSFMNFWILKKMNDETFKIYQQRLMDCSEYKIKRTPLHVAGSEGNENIFWFLYSSLTKGENFKSKKPEIGTYLLKVPENDYTCFVHYFLYCDDNHNILNAIKKVFPKRFFYKLMEIEMFNGGRFLQSICENDKHVIKVFNFLHTVFKKDSKSLQEIISLSDWYGRSFLHNAFENSKNDVLMYFFNELDLLKSMFGQDFVKKLVMMKKETFGTGVFLSSYAGSRYFDNDLFIKYLNRLKILCNGIDEEFFLAVDTISDTLLHRFCRSATNFNLLKMIQWVIVEFGEPFLIKLFGIENEFNGTIFHSFSSRQSNSGSQFISILEFLKHTLNLENSYIIKMILFKNDKYGKTVFSNFISYSQDKDFCLEFIEYLGKTLDLSDQDFKKYIEENKFFLVNIAQIKEKSSQSEILDIISRKFGETFITDNFYSEKYLHEICWDDSGWNTDEILKYLNFIEDKTDFEKYILGKNSKNQTILFNFKSRDHLIKIIKWLKDIFKNKPDFLENLLLHVDEKGNTFFIYALKKCWKRLQIAVFIELLNFFVTNFDKNFAKQILIIENEDNQNCLSVTCAGRKFKYTPIESLPREDLPEAFELLLKHFRNDKNFLKLLINDEAMKNQGVQNWRKLKIDETGEISDESQIYEESDSSSSSNDNLYYDDEGDYEDYDSYGGETIDQLFFFNSSPSASESDLELPLNEDDFFPPHV